jgi:hypothetical protein
MIKIYLSLLTREVNYKMFKRFIALILSVTLMLGSIVQPAYASSFNTVGSNNGLINNNTYNYYGDKTLRESILDTVDETGKAFLKGLAEGLGGWTAVVAVCMAADAAASTVFPPAAALLPYCPAIGVAAGGGGALSGLKDAVVAH